MSTDPNPWTALVTALRRMQPRGEGSERGCPGCGHGVDVCDAADDEYEDECIGRIARSALASWESRPRLRDDRELQQLVVQLGVDIRSAESGERITLYARFLDAIEARLFAPGKGTT